MARLGRTCGERMLRRAADVENTLMGVGDKMIVDRGGE